jgi:hypothetical protein
LKHEVLFLGWVAWNWKEITWGTLSFLRPSINPFCFFILKSITGVSCLASLAFLRIVWWVISYSTWHSPRESSLKEPTQPPSCSASLEMSHITLCLDE